MAFCLAGCSASAQSPSIDGRWLSGDGERVVEVGPCGPGATMRCGTIIWLQSPTDSDGIPVKDIANADPLADQRGFRFARDGVALHHLGAAGMTRHNHLLEMRE